MDKIIEEMTKMVRSVLESRTDITFIPDLDKPIAEELLKHYQPKLLENAVVLTREEYDILIAVENERIRQARKEMAKEYNDKLVAIIQHLFDIGQIDFKAKIEFLKENEKLAKQHGVEMKE